MVCSGPKDWKEYVKEFQDNAVNISGKPTEELFSFNDTGPIIAKYEAEIADYVDKLEKEYRASAKGALAKGTISSTGTNSSYQVFYGTNSLYLHF